MVLTHRWPELERDALGFGFGYSALLGFRTQLFTPF